MDNIKKKVVNCDSTSCDESVTLNVELHEEEQKVKRKYRLSLNSRNKYKDDNQASIISFFQKVPSPEAIKKSPNAEKVLKKNSKDKNSLNNHKMKKKSKSTSHRKTKKNSEEKLQTKYNNHIDIDVLDGKENKEQNKNIESTKNAFTFMMDSRCKSIGQNSSGKELEISEEFIELHSENQRKLKRRKTTLQKWADKKGAQKRKVEDDEKGIVIQHKLKKRAKRFKKMLKVDEGDVKKIKKKHKICRIIESDSDPNEIISNQEIDEVENNCLIDRPSGVTKKWKMRLKITLAENEFIYKENNMVQLAPLFVKAKHIDKAVIDVRKKFLHSDIPEHLKNEMKKKQEMSGHSLLEDLNYQVFPLISHIKVNSYLQNHSPVTFNFIKPEVYKPQIQSSHSLIVINNETAQFQQIPQVMNLRKSVRLIKTENPDYPVYKVFKCLYEKHDKSLPRTNVTVKKTRLRRKSKNQIRKEIMEPFETKCQIWTDLYKPNSSEEMFGNSVSVRKFKKWLQACRETCNIMKKRKFKNSESSDFITSDSEGTASSQVLNTIILCGPHGSGKTVCVYAVCNELGIQVLELNASSKRTGKRLLQDFQEATQSHQVRKSNQNSLKTFIKKENVAASNSNKVKMCLLLIEDVDIVFEQDDSFISALSQLLISSKRPIVLTTTDANCLHLRKFFSQYSTIYFNAFKTKILSTWLQLVCLVEGLYIDRGEIENLLENNKSDGRCTLLQLQFFVQSTRQTSTLEKSFINRKKFELGDDDCFSMSWLDEGNECSVNDNKINIDNSKFNCNFLPLDMGCIWWNLSHFLSAPRELKPKADELENISDLFDTLSRIDVMYKCLNVDLDLEPVHNDRLVKDSLELIISDEDFNVHQSMGIEWSHVLLDGYRDMHKGNIYGTVSSFKEKRWRHKQYDSREVLLKAIPMSCQLDRKQVNVDYLAMLRGIARSEDARAASSNKRRNRFYNYLRNLDVSYNDSQFKTMCNVFCNKDRPL